MLKGCTSLLSWKVTVMVKRPTLSVLIPTYNRAAFLGKTIESVMGQTFSDLEIIVVDDGSTDSTEKVITQLVKDTPSWGERIRYFFQRNQGKSVALNYGLSEARGEWIAFQDSDDLWLPNKIEEQFHAIRQYAPHARACFTDARFINDSSIEASAFELAGKRYTTTTGVFGNPIELVFNFWIFMQTILLHSRVMAEVGEFDPCLWTGQDEDFVFRLSLHTAMCYVNSPLVLIDRTPNQSGRLTDIRSRRRYDELQLRQRRYDRWLRLSEGSSRDLQAALRDKLRGAYSQQANWLLVEGRYREARHAAGLAVRTQCRPGILAKWCLAKAAPSLARRIVIHRSLHANRTSAQELQPPPLASSGLTGNSEELSLTRRNARKRSG
jgi:glycosyltransferase involved in cell wall biosynthesis